MSFRVHIGYFEDDRLLLAAARECRERAIPVADVVSPHPIHGLDPVLGLRPSRLPWVTLIGGAAGLSLGLGFQYWSSAVSWPLDVGGKPFDSLPAFVPVAFEMTILIAGLATFFMLLLRCGLRPGKRLKGALDSTTDARMALILEQKDATLQERDFVELLERHGAVKISQLSSEEVS